MYANAESFNIATEESKINVGIYGIIIMKSCVIYHREKVNGRTGDARGEG